MTEWSGLLLQKFNLYAAPVPVTDFRDSHSKDSGVGSATSASQMRILLFLHSFGPGGVERVALRLAGAWAEAGHDVRLLVGRNEGPDRSVAPSNITYDFAPRHPLTRISVLSVRSNVRFGLLWESGF